MSCMYESFSMKNELEHGMFPLNDLIHAFIITSILSLPSPSYELRPCVHSSSSLKLKPVPILLNMYSWAQMSLSL